MSVAWSQAIVPKCAIAAFAACSRILKAGCTSGIKLLVFCVLGRGAKGMVEHEYPCVVVGLWVCARACVYLCIYVLHAVFKHFGGCLCIYVAA